jgi:SAM-dependent methyltransferase
VGAARDVVEPVARYYAQKLIAHGSTPQGVDWNSDESQQLRFTQLLGVVEDTEEERTVLDYGCGYGALAERVLAAGPLIRYVGFDVCTPMIERARADVRDPRCTFTDRESDLAAADYTLASGIFNVRLEASVELWGAHVARTISRLAELSREGFAFNMLTRYADGERLRDYLYYADPGEYFKLCKERCSRDVALLHDYQLYEFTLLVRMGSEPKPLLNPA